MAMRVDEAGDQRLAAAVQLECQPLGRLGPGLALLALLGPFIFRFLVAALDQLFDLAVIVDHQRAEAHDLAIGVQRDAVHIVDDARRQNRQRTQGERDRGA